MDARTYDSHTLYSELTAKIRRVRRAEHSVSLQTAVLNSLAAVITIWTLAVTLELLFEFEPAGRTVLYWGAVALGGALSAWFLAGPVGRLFGVNGRQNDDAIATRVGWKIPEVGDRLVNTLQLYRGLGDGAAALGYSPELMQASIYAQGEPLRHYDYSVIIEREQRQRGLIFFLLSCALSIGLYSTTPAKYNLALYRLVHYRTFFMKPAPFALSIAPGNVKIVRGDSVQVIVSATGIPPRTVTLMVTAEGQSKPDSYELQPDTSGKFRYTLGGIKARTTYYALSGPVRTADYSIAVTEHPEIQLLQVTVTPPTATHQKSQRLPDNTGDVSGLHGTIVALNVTASTPVVKAFAVQIYPRGGVQVTAASASAMSASSQVAASYDTVRIPLSVNENHISGGFPLSRNGEYFITLTSADGLQNTSPIHYTMSVAVDAAPTIALIEPTGKAQVTEQMKLATEVHIGDDYGFSGLRLYYRLTGSKFEKPWKEFKSRSVPIPTGLPSGIDVPFIWDLSDLHMVPEDELEAYFEVADNDFSGGPKRARTATFSVRFPSLDEMLKQADTIQAKATADLDKALQQADQARKEMEQLNRDIMKQLAQNQKQANWQSQQKMQELVQRQAEMQKNLEKIADNLRTLADKLQEAKAIAPETLQKYEELQKLFQEIKNPELMNSMQQLQKEMDKMTPEQMQEALKNYKFNEEQFKQSIERTMKILERMKTEQKVDEAQRRAENLAKEQHDLNEQLAKTNPQDKPAQQKLADEQRALSKEAKELQQQASDLAKQMEKQAEQSPDMPSKEMKDAQQQLEKENPGEEMDKSAQDMEQGDQQQAEQQGQKAEQSAKDFAQKMKGVKQKMGANSRQAAMNKMKKAMQDLLELSKREEQIKQGTDNAGQNSQQMKDLAQKQQQNKQDLGNVADQMADLSQKTFSITPEMGRELGDAMQSMQGATQSLEKRNGSQASQQEGEAMGALNRAAMMMQQSLAQMQGQGQGQGQQGEGQGGQGMGSFQQRLQELAAQQQMINMAQSQGQGGQEGQQGQQGKNGKNGKNGQGGKDGQGEGEGQNGEGGQQQRRLQQQESAVKKSLDQLNKEAQQQGSTRKNMVGDLNRAAQEIEEVLRDMQSGQVTQQTQERQERILSRLLDAVRSTRERDFDKERESKPGQDVVRNSPPNITIPNDPTLARTPRDPLEGRDAGYTKDYEYLIRKYLEGVK